MGRKGGWRRAVVVACRVEFGGREAGVEMRQRGRGEVGLIHLFMYSMYCMMGEGGGGGGGGAFGGWGAYRGTED